MRSFAFWLPVCLLLGVAVVTPTPSAAGQFHEGDVIAGWNYDNGDVIVGGLVQGADPGIMLGVRPGGIVYTLSTFPSLFVPQCVAPTPDNRSLWIMGVDYSLVGRIYRIAPDGTVVSEHDTQDFLPWMFEVEPGGTALAVDIGFSSVVRFREGAGVTTLYSGMNGRLNGGAIDLGTGDFIACERRTGAVYRLSLSGRPSTVSVVSGLPSVMKVGLHSDPLTGNMLIGAGRTLFGLRLGMGVPVLTTVWHSSTTLDLESLDRDPRDGTFLAATHFPTQPDAVIRFDPVAATVTPVAKPGIDRVNTVTIAGGRHLSAADRPEVGKVFHLRLSSPTEPGSPYLTALSFGFTPGFQVNGRTIHLNPDPLFFYSLSDATVFVDFQGALDARGEAFPEFLIPPIKALQGIRFYAVSVTIQSGGVSTVSEPVGVTIR